MFSPSRSLSSMNNLFSYSFNLANIHNNGKKLSHGTIPLATLLKLLDGKVNQFIEQLLGSRFDAQGVKYSICYNLRK